MALLIRNVQILGGEREYPKPLDVFINDDKISAIGNLGAKKGDQTIDGQGMYLAPGFIDVNTDSDHYLTLFDHPAQEDFLKQGVTTILGGMCGSSLAPLLYGSLESIRKWTDPNKINVNWHSMAEFLAVLKAKPLGVNFGTMVGHSTIRRAISGDALRDLNKNELNVFGETLKRALQEGGLGLSTGLAYVHSFRTPPAEIKYLATIAKENGGIYATHLRKYGPEVCESIEETVKLAKEVGISSVVSHFQPLKGSETEYEAALAHLDALPKELNIYFDVYPSTVSMMPLYMFLPEWARNGGIETMSAHMRDEWMRSRIKKELPVVDLDAFTVAQAPGNEVFVGKTLRDIKNSFASPSAEDALSELMRATNLRANIFYKNGSEDLLMRFLKNPRSLIASNAPSVGESLKPALLKPERSSNTFMKFLFLVLEQNLMPLPEAIRKITRMPAELYNLKGRGVVKEGNYADLVLMKGSEIKYVIVNGRLAVENGTFLKQFAGRPITHTA